MGSEKDDTFRTGAMAKVKAFIESVRTGLRLNNAGEAAESNVTAILGRIAAYQQRLVTRDEMTKSTERLQANCGLPGPPTAGPATSCC
jgi:hypothetical protein